MSGEVVGWAMKQVTGSPAAKLVLAKLADNANEQGLCWPSIKLIVEHTELGQATVYKHLATLEELGLIEPVDVSVRGEPKKGYQLVVPGSKAAIPPRGKQKQVENDIPLGGKKPLPAGKSIPPAGTPIEEPPIEPSKEPSSLTPAGAGESENIASLRMPEQARFPEFRKVVADTWPDGFPPKDQAAALREFTQLTRRVSADTLVACAVAHGEAEMARKAKRGPGAGQLLVKFPSNWLKAGDWEGYIPTVEKNCAKEADIALALARVCLALGNDMVDFLQRQGMHDNALAALDGVTLEPGPPPVLVTSSGAQPHILAKYQFALERRFGDGLIVMPPPVRRTA